ncbi:MAG: DUF4292 domain-containing protein [Rhodothermia bacterium]|nr:MAG: DUF4292 domain-containing protein [Rhodothermia bacterium]
MPGSSWIFSSKGTSVVSLFIGVLFSACGSIRPTTTVLSERPEGFPDHSVEEILSKLPASPDAFDELYAETAVAVSSPDEKGRFSTKITYRRDDSLLIRVRFPLGIEGARVLVTRDSAWVYDRIHEEVLAGTHEEIAAVLPSAIFGTNFIDDTMDFIQPDPSIAWILSSDSLRYHLVSPDSTLRIDIDPVLWRIVHIEQKSTEGTVLEQRWYTNFRTINEQLLPLRMIISRPEEDTRLSMVLRKIDTTPGPLSFDLGLKSDTRRIFIRE